MMSHKYIDEMRIVDAILCYCSLLEDGQSAEKDIGTSVTRGMYCDKCFSAFHHNIILYIYILYYTVCIRHARIVCG
jgi:hypothetical protein